MYCYNIEDKAHITNHKSELDKLCQQIKVDVYEKKNSRHPIFVFQCENIKFILKLMTDKQTFN